VVVVVVVVVAAAAAGGGGGGGGTAYPSVTLDFQYNVTGKLETLTKRVSNHMLIP
jgi:3-oxoacyl-ACP reductase-like protein